VKIKVGDFEIHSLSDGYFWLDGGMMFRQAKIQWQEFYKPDEKNRIRLAVRCYLIKGRILTLFDTGMGDQDDPMFEKIKDISYKDFFSINQTGDNLISNMHMAGFAEKDMRFITQSHLHLDHTGWHTYTDMYLEKIMPTFPNASYLVHEIEWSAAEKQHPLSLKSYRAESYETLLSADPIWKMKFLWKIRGINMCGVRDDWFQVERGLFLIRTGGHTKGHWSMLIDGGNQKAFFPGDLMPTSKHIPPVNVMGYDLYPMRVYREKIKFLERAAREHWLIFFDHDPDYIGGYIKKEHGLFKFESLC
jgi:glyoxylase-like metal-dependent hydrolase (beta-lactamase superfamily II)